MINYSNCEIFLAMLLKSSPNECKLITIIQYHSVP